MGKDQKTLWLLFGVTLASRLLLVPSNSAESTNSVWLMTLFHNRCDLYMPLYPFLIQVFHLVIRDLELAAKLVSVLAGSLLVVPLFLLTRRTFGRSAALAASGLYLLLPEALRWNPRIETDSLFTLFFFMTVQAWTALWSDRRKSRLALLIFLGGCAFLTRHDGSAFAVLAAAGIMLVHRSGREEGTCLWLPFSIVPWVLGASWIAARGFPFAGWYVRGWDWGGGYALMQLERYVTALPVVLSPLVLPLAAVGAFAAFSRNANEPEPRRVLILTVAALAAVWLATRMAMIVFSPRYLLPLLPFAAVFAGSGIQVLSSVRLRRGVLAMALAAALGVSVLYVWSQRDFFGDIRRTALFLRAHASADRALVSDEDVKTSFWSGQQLEQYQPGGALAPGTWIVLHEFYSDIPGETSALEKRYRLRLVFEDTSRVCLMVPDYVPFASPPPLPAYTAKRLFREFKSVILEVQGRR